MNDVHVAEEQQGVLVGVRIGRGAETLFLTRREVVDLLRELEDLVDRKGWR